MKDYIEDLKDYLSCIRMPSESIYLISSSVKRVNYPFMETIEFIPFEKEEFEMPLSTYYSTIEFNKNAIVKNYYIYKMDGISIKNLFNKYLSCIKYYLSRVIKNYNTIVTTKDGKCYYCSLDGIIDQDGKYLIKIVLGMKRYKELGLCAERLIVYINQAMPNIRNYSDLCKQCIQFFIPRAYPSLKEKNVTIKAMNDCYVTRPMKHIEDPQVIKLGFQMWIDNL